MRVGPSVVIGLGSSGAYVVSNLERMLYEVLAETSLDTCRFISIDTDTTRKEDEPPPGGNRGVSISIYEKNLGQAILNLKHILGEDFNWCPEDLRVSGPGAGNLRAGGRLMFFNKFPDIWQLIRDVTTDVRHTAALPQTEQKLQAEMTRRGMSPGEGIVNPQAAVVYVIGTLAGGTCSGSCVDFGYLIRDAAPGFRRIGVFFLPDKNASPVFLQNTWAALRDLEYFRDNPDDYRPKWPTANRTAQPYLAGAAHPYDLVYLLSQQDEDKQFRLSFRPKDARAPLLVMASMQLALDLLGMFEHRAAKLADTNTQAITDRKHRMFLNYNLRVVSYPKYEISEAAACKVVAESICAGWLDEQHHDSPTGKVALKPEAIQAEGRQRWNTSLTQVWTGARSTVNLNEWADKVREGNLARPADDLLHQFSGNVSGTVFSHIAHQLPGRRAELKKLIKSGVASKVEQTNNLRSAELYLNGVKQELEHTLQYWSKLGIPGPRDDDSWTGIARRLVDAVIDRRKSYAVLTLAAAKPFLKDELEEICVRLQMYLMQSTLIEIREWLDTEMAAFLQQLRTAIRNVQGKAARRLEVLNGELSNYDPPILRLSRSRNEGFADEIRSLASQKPVPKQPLLRINADNEFEGLFAIRVNQDYQDSQKLHGMFLTLKNMLQPELLRSLESKGPVNIVQEINDQGRVPQAVNLLNNALGMSVATRLALTKTQAAVPSFVIAKDKETAETLLTEHLRKANPDLPPMTTIALPMFDHMAIFYQEGARLSPDELADAPILREAYETRLQQSDPEYLNPLHHLQRQTKGADAT